MTNPEQRVGNAVVGLLRRVPGRYINGYCDPVQATIVNSDGQTEQYRGLAIWSTKKQDWDVTLSDGRKLELSGAPR